MDGLGIKGETMHNFEFVSKNEYQPVRIELESIIRKAQKITKKKYGFTF